MMSSEAFVKLCASHIERGEPFIAYRHPHGFLTLLTAQPYTAFKVEGDSTGVHEKEIKRAQAPANLVKSLRKEIARMRKDPHCHPLQVVEFDGVNVLMEGGGLDEIQALRVPGLSDPMDT